MEGIIPNRAARNRHLLQTALAEAGVADLRICGDVYIFQAPTQIKRPSADFLDAIGDRHFCQPYATLKHILADLCHTILDHDFREICPSLGRHRYRFAVFIYRSLQICKESIRYLAVDTGHNGLDHFAFCISHQLDAITLRVVIIVARFVVILRLVVQVLISRRIFVIGFVEAVALYRGLGRQYLQAQLDGGLYRAVVGLVAHVLGHPSHQRHQFLCVGCHRRGCLAVQGRPQLRALTDAGLCRFTVKGNGCAIPIDRKRRPAELDIVGQLELLAVHIDAHCLMHRCDLHGVGQRQIAVVLHLQIDDLGVARLPQGVLVEQIL